MPISSSHYHDVFSPVNRHESGVIQNSAPWKMHDNLQFADNFALLYKLHFRRSVQKTNGPDI